MVTDLLLVLLQLSPPPLEQIPVELNLLLLLGLQVNPPDPSSTHELGEGTQATVLFE